MSVNETPSSPANSLCITRRCKSGSSIQYVQVWPLQPEAVAAQGCLGKCTLAFNVLAFMLKFKRFLQWDTLQRPNFTVGIV